MEKSYIEREAALRAVADVVEVVRCKNCKHGDPENGHCDHILGTSLPFSRKPDDYCSYGERWDAK